MASKKYELSNHLGNVLAVVSDRKIPTDANANGVHNYYSADVTSATDYYAFGVAKPGRSFVASSKNKYRYGFNSMERDDEIYGAGNSYTAEYWQYDSRLGRRWNVDPVVKVHESPYAIFANNPIWFIDPNGADTLKFSGSEEEITKVINGIKEMFDANLSYSYTCDKNGNTNGVSIYSVNGSMSNDENKLELHEAFKVLVNNGTEVIDILKVKSTYKITDEVERKGGMSYTSSINKNGVRTQTISITEQWFTNEWNHSGMKKPSYDYSKRGLMLDWDTWRRYIPFSEALGHEIIHAYRAKLGLTEKIERLEENATIEMLNNWREKAGAAKRGYTLTANWYESLYGIRILYHPFRYPKNFETK